ncbi:hypothetical protein NITLEN_30137 [Nitrospira lenta]|uniref:Uncharacterized protein n=1 Tax=Nitrospira lenta TaxID=1436998 RepID=A0A330L7X6_9BACT|nr:hypothetical protein NITLEN_30137 [Nitrospira lenta]
MALTRHPKVLPNPQRWVLCKSRVRQTGMNFRGLRRLFPLVDGSGRREPINADRLLRREQTKREAGEENCEDYSGLLIPVPLPITPDPDFTENGSLKV